MTKLRARLLVSLILAAVTLAAIGVGTSWATPRADHGSRSGGFPGSRVTPMSGEPDAGGHTVPPPTVRPTACVPGVNPWFAMLWYQWVVEHHQKKASGHQ